MINNIPRVSDITFAKPSTEVQPTYCKSTIIQLVDSGAKDLVLRFFHYDGENVHGIMGVNCDSELMNQPHDIVIPPCRPYCECDPIDRISFEQAKIELL